MKKTLLSVVAGLAVINVANAEPSLEDRIAMCKRHSDTHVWVEKTQFCARIDPCTSYSYDDVYCIHAYEVSKPEGSYANLLIGRYVKNVLGTGIQELKYLGDNKIAIKTTDLDYKVIKFGSSQNGAEAVCWAYGKEITHDENGGVVCKNVTESECADMGDFARLVDAEGMYIKQFISNLHDQNYNLVSHRSVQDIYEDAQREKKGSVESFFIDDDCHLEKY